MPGMLKKALFLQAYKSKYRNFMEMYEKALELEIDDRSSIKAYQDKKLRELIEYCYENVPYYGKLFHDLGLRPRDVECANDLEKLPVMTKDTIRSHETDMTPKNLASQKYAYRETGGSTGDPLRYRVSHHDVQASWALLYTAWHKAGYEPGDSVAILGGASLFPQTMSRLQYRMKKFVLSHDFISSFDMGEERRGEIVSRLESYRPRYIGGFASSLYLLARHLNDRSMGSRIRCDAVFSTAEVLFPFQREEMERAFDCRVFDQYGANDGGVSASECDRHKGMHVDVLRGILEVVDEEGKQIAEGTGRILATSFFNMAQPFVRYEVGDLGKIDGSICDCGRNTDLLMNIEGRITDHLIFSNGRVVPGPVIVHLFRLFPQVRQYQVVQKDAGSIDIMVVRGDGYDSGVEERLEDTLRESCGDADMRFHLVESIPQARSGKWKFIIREYEP